MQISVNVRCLGRNTVRQWLICAGLAAVLWGGGGCSPERGMLDDRNPFYLRGLRLRQESKYEEAVAAFLKCLRLSPGSAKAHLQLAMLYEDRLGEPFKAVYHYREYLRQAPQSENRDLVQKWVTRAERTVLQQLMDQYPEDVAVLLGKAQSAVAGTTLTARELYLVQRLRKVNAELVALRQAQAPMDAAGSRASVGTVAAPAVLPSEPPVEEPPPTAEGPMPEPASEIVPAAGGSSGAMSPGVSPGGTAGQPGSGEVRGAGGSLTGQSGVSAGKAVSASPATAAAGGAVARVPPAPGKPFVPVRRLSSGGSAAASASENDRGQRGSYTVQKGDTLTSVAKKLCGTPSAWKRIQDANQDTLKGSANLRPGMVLRIPPRPAAGAGAKTP